MKKTDNEPRENEKGQALMLVLAYLVLGGLTLVPLLSHMTTGLNAGEIREEQVALNYAADAGMEYALWVLRTDYITFDPTDYDTEFILNPPQNINDKEVTITMKQIWPLEGLESSANGTENPDAFLVTGGVVNQDDGEYQVQITYDGSEGDLPVDRVAVWLPPGFDYMADTSTGLTTDNPAEADWKGGKTLTWDFSPAVNFLDLPLPELPGGGFIPAQEYPTSRSLFFNVTPNKTARSSLSWARTTNSDPYLTWETGYTINRITSTATDVATGRSISFEGFTYVDRVLGLEGFSGISLPGDYRAIGHTMMEDTNGDRKRDTFFAERTSSITSIPEGSEVRQAFLYWSGWRDYPKGNMEADKYVGLKINGQSVYFDESGVAQLGLPASVPDSEILYADNSGEYEELEVSGAANNYMAIEEPVPDDSGSYVYKSGGGSALDTYNIMSSGEANGSIDSVAVYARARAAGVDDMRLQIAIQPDSTIYFGSEFNLTGGSGWADYSENWTTNPDTGSPWAWSDIEDLQVGVHLFDDGDGSPEVTQVYAEINYTPEFQGVEASKWAILENGFPDYAYSSFRDVTELVKLVSFDGNADYTVIGVAGDTGKQQSYAGWSMIIIFSNPDEEVHQFFLYDNFLYSGVESSHTFDITGFKVPQDASVTLTFFVGEGDEHYVSDYIQLNGYYLSGGVNPENNVWNGKSSSIGGELIDGIDLDTFNASSPIINQGDTSAELTLSTHSDRWNLIYVMLSFRSEFSGLTPNKVGIISYRYADGS